MDAKLLRTQAELLRYEIQLKLEEAQACGVGTKPMHASSCCSRRDQVHMREFLKNKKSTCVSTRPRRAASRSPASGRGHGNQQARVR
jgi:hypothetical protein